MSSYFLALKSNYVNFYLSLKAYDIPYIALIIKRLKKLFQKQKAKCLPIIKNILEKIIKNKLVDLDKFNIDTIFKIAWASFFRLDKITYTGTKLKKALFSNDRITKSEFFLLRVINIWSYT